jgi:hypothetical protein
MERTSRFSFWLSSGRHLYFVWFSPQDNATLCGTCSEKGLPYYFYNSFVQCNGSGSKSGSGPYVFGPPGYGSISQIWPGSGSSKNSKKNIDSYCFVTSLYDFLSLKNDVNVPSKSNKQKKLRKIIFLLTSCRSLTKIAGSGSISQRYGSADPDPYKNCMNPQHCFYIYRRCLFRN